MYGRDLPGYRPSRAKRSRRGYVTPFVRACARKDRHHEGLGCSGRDRLERLLDSLQQGLLSFLQEVGRQATILLEKSVDIVKAILNGFILVLFQSLP